MCCLISLSSSSLIRRADKFFRLRSKTAMLIGPSTPPGLQSTTCSNAQAVAKTPSRTLGCLPSAQKTFLINAKNGSFDHFPLSNTKFYPQFSFQVENRISQIRTNRVFLLRDKPQGHRTAPQMPRLKQSLVCHLHTKLWRFAWVYPGIFCYSMPQKRLPRIVDQDLIAQFPL